MHACTTAIGLIVAVIAATNCAGAYADEAGSLPRPIYCTKTCGSTTRRESEWTGHFEGEMRIPITRKVTGGWNAKIQFQSEVEILQIWNAKITYKEYLIYYISNESWNGDLDAGTILDDVGFIAKIPDGQIAWPFYVHMFGQPECPCYYAEQHGS